MKGQISIIVPVYRVEKYIYQCVESILDQTFQNFQLILVDDGSDDGSAAICDRYARQDSRIKVIHKENGGLSDARNVGLKEATGEYIAFIDSDDAIHPRFLETLYYTIIKFNCDIAICGIEKFSEKYPYEISLTISETVTIKKPVECFYKTNSLYDVAWNKLYKREIIADICYPQGRVHEDIYTTYKIIMNAEKIGVVSENMYFYRQRDDSITGKNKNIPRPDIEEALWERIKYFKGVDYVAYVEALKVYVTNVCIILSAQKDGLMTMGKSQNDKMLERIRGIRKIILCSHEVKMKDKFRIFTRCIKALLRKE